GGALIVASETWGPDQALISAGYVKPDGSADKDRFLNELYYGFKWLNARNLLPAIVRSVPFPQIQKWFLAFLLDAPFAYHVADSYLLIYSNSIRNIKHNCGSSEMPTQPANQNWQLRAGTPPPSSPYDGTQPDYLSYVAATNLVSWHAGQVAPALALSGSGG